MKKLLASASLLTIISGCTDNSYLGDINLICSCIESESTSCSYDNDKLIVDFANNKMIFGSGTYRNLGTTPTSFSVRSNSDFVVLNRNTKKLTFERKKLREIYQCK